MNIALYFVDTKDVEMRDNTTPVVVTLEAPPRPPHLAEYRSLEEIDEGSDGLYIDGRPFARLEHHRGQTLWVWRITGGLNPHEDLQGCWAEARIETYQEQVTRLEGYLTTANAEAALLDAGMNAVIYAGSRRPLSQIDANKVLKVLERAVEKADYGHLFYEIVSRLIHARLARRKVPS